MTDLADKIERADGPSRELDAEIAVAFGLMAQDEANECLAWVGTEHFPECPTHGHLPHYTASLDAAMSLVKDEWRESIHLTWNRAIVWDSIARASTPALALCAAALRARDQDQ